MNPNNCAELKLNIGCGTDTRPCYINLDIAQLPGVDIVHDINMPLPFAAGVFTEILALDVLEHVTDLPAVMKELHRVLAPDGRLILKVPHFTSRNNYIDPTHKRMFSVFTFDFFAQNHTWKRTYYFSFSFSGILQRTIIFERPGGINLFFLIEWLVNLIPVAQKIYEATLLHNIFPAENIKITIKKIADLDSIFCDRPRCFCNLMPSL
jgi:SAM-dependent methyltransferase